jgi:protein SCO1/2
VDDLHADMSYERSMLPPGRVALGIGIFAGCVTFGIVVGWIAFAASGSARNAPNDATRPQVKGPVMETAGPADLERYRKEKTAPPLGELVFRGADGTPITLDDAIDSRPMIVVLGYLTCRDLCGTTTAGVTQALRQAALVPGRDYRALFVSIDPKDGGAPLTRAWNERIPAIQRDAWRFVSADEPTIARLTDALGWRFHAEDGGFAHPAGFVLLTPQAKIARHFAGVRFDAKELRAAIEQASNERVAGFVDRLVIACTHFDPVKGRYSVAILDALRALALVLAAIALFLLWRRARRNA